MPAFIRHSSWTHLFAALGLAAIVCAGAGLYYYKATRVLAGAVDLRHESEVQVVLTDGGFVPQHLRVTKGASVVFTTTRDRQFWPASNPHPSHVIYNQFDPQRALEPGESWTFVPDKPGVWGFHDHLRSYYTGILYVEE